MSATASPLFQWIYFRAENDWFSTVVDADGKVSQVRRHRDDKEASGERIGRISAARATAIFAEARHVLPIADESTAKPSMFPQFYASLRDTDGTERDMKIPESAMTSSSPLAPLRSSVLAARRSAYGMRLRWSSTGVRLGGAFCALSAFWGFLCVQDNMTIAALERSGERLQARVIDRTSRPSKSKGYPGFIVVQLQSPANGEQTARIEDYLSVANFTAAVPGSVVSVLYDPAKKRAVIESDIERFKKTDKSWMWQVPLFWFVAGAILILCLGRRRVGTYEDGREYLIRGDRVERDEKDMAIPGLAVNIGRLLDRF